VAAAPPSWWEEEIKIKSKIRSKTEIKGSGKTACNFRVGAG
jgi:hypothetical protein